MYGKKQKFIIGKDGFKSSRVTLHRDIDQHAKGGGWWFWDSEKDVLYLYGKSYDFGSVSLDQIEANMDTIKRRHFKNSKVIFEPDSEKGIYDILKENMDSFRALELVSKNDYI